MKTTLIQEDTQFKRRAFIKTAALFGFAVALSGIPLASFFISPALKKGTGKWVDFGAAEDLTLGSIEMLSYEFMVKDGWQVLPQRGFVWAKTESAGNIHIFSSTCTHLACNIIWREDEKIFECPCHSGRFDIDGRPIAGPPTKPLSVLKHKIEDENLLVYLTF
ncbi:MAG: ubiquinol-cytochrome c reductase iron-sulfur subunit [Desulfobacterales bacterium]|jgi:Rieske Fe-S protein